MEFYSEQFDSIQELLSTLNKRPNSPYMEGENSSHGDDAQWSGTKTYKDAENLLRFGDTSHLEEVKSKVKSTELEFEKLLYAKKTQIKNMPIGFIPNVPNFLQGKPDSMINILSENQKRKCIHILYFMSGNCGYKVRDFIEVGVNLVAAITVIEKTGVQVKLDCCFFDSSAGDQTVAALFPLKNYGERFNIEKICFPMINPAMFRRIGFKWLETCTGLITSDFRCGYGRTSSLDFMMDKLSISNQDTYGIRMQDMLGLEMEDYLMKLGFK